MNLRMFPHFRVLCPHANARVRMLLWGPQYGFSLKHTGLLELLLPLAPSMLCSLMQAPTPLTKLLLHARHGASF